MWGLGLPQALAGVSVIDVLAVLAVFEGVGNGQGKDGACSGVRGGVVDESA